MFRLWQRHKVKQSKEKCKGCRNFKYNIFINDYECFLSPCRKEDCLTEKHKYYKK